MSGAKATGNAAVTAAKATGNAAVTAAKATGSAVEYGANAIGNGAESAWNWATSSDSETKKIDIKTTLSSNDSSVTETQMQMLSAARYEEAFLKS